jgi:hypothetical protein
MPLLCYTVEHFFYIPPVLVVWRRTTSQTGAFATALKVRPDCSYSCRRDWVTVAGVYRQFYQRCSEPPGHMAPVDRASFARARETVHIYGDKTERKHEWSGRTFSGHNMYGRPRRVRNTT